MTKIQNLPRMLSPGQRGGGPHPRRPPLDLLLIDPPQKRILALRANCLGSYEFTPYVP
jgi:hypothetical protein